METQIFVAFGKRFISVNGAGNCSGHPAISDTTATYPQRHLHSGPHRQQEAKRVSALVFGVRTLCEVGREAS